MHSEYADIEQCVRNSLQAYFRDLGGASPHDLHGTLMRLVEKPLLQAVMEQAGHNQSRAAQWLGINRNTLRKKLDEHQMGGSGALPLKKL